VDDELNIEGIDYCIGSGTKDAILEMANDHLVVFEEQLDFMSKIKNLSKQAQFIVNLIINPNNELIKSVNKKRKKRLTKNDLKKVLRSVGWKYSVISTIFKEIEEFFHLKKKTDIIDYKLRNIPEGIQTKKLLKVKGTQIMAKSKKEEKKGGKKDQSKVIAKYAKELGVKVKKGDTEQDTLDALLSAVQKNSRDKKWRNDKKNQEMIDWYNDTLEALENTSSGDNDNNDDDSKGKKSKKDKKEVKKGKKESSDNDDNDDNDDDNNNDDDNDDNDDNDDDNNNDDDNDDNNNDNNNDDNDNDDNDNNDDSKGKGKKGAKKEVKKVKKESSDNDNNNDDDNNNNDDNDDDNDNNDNDNNNDDNDDNNNNDNNNDDNNNDDSKNTKTKKGRKTMEKGVKKEVKKSKEKGVKKEVKKEVKKGKEKEVKKETKKEVKKGKEKEGKDKYGSKLGTNRAKVNEFFVEGGTIEELEKKCKKAKINISLKEHISYLEGRGITVIAKGKGTEKTYKLK
jgi:hypothetical protein